MLWLLQLLLLVVVFSFVELVPFVTPAALLAAVSVGVDTGVPPSDVLLVVADLALSGIGC